MNLIQRITNICLKPKEEWTVIDTESSNVGDLFKTYIIPLSLIPVIASFIGMTVFGVTIPFLGTIRTPMMMGITTAVLQFGLGLVSIYLVSLIINALAPSFDGQKDPVQALKVIAFAMTPGWVAGVLNIIPSLGILVLLAGLYGIYVLYLGLPILMKAPKEKALGYTIVTVICSIVMYVIIGIVVASITGAGAYSAGKMGLSGLNKSSMEANSPLGEWAKMGEQMEQAGKKMEEAQKSGDAQAQMSAATEALGAALGGNGNVEVVDMAKLKALLPEELNGLKRTNIEAEKNAMGDFKISKAQAQYSDDNNKQIDVTITDFGGNKMAGMMLGMGMMEMDKETAGGYEKVYKADGRHITEKFDKNSSSGEYHVLVAGRFMMEINGQQVDMGALKAAANKIGFSNLEAMKNEGVK